MTLGKKEEPSHLKVKCDSIAKAVLNKLKEIPNDDQGVKDSYFIKEKINAILMIGQVITPEPENSTEAARKKKREQIYDQMKFTFISLENYKHHSGRETTRVITFFQEQIFQYFGDLNQKL